MADAQRESDLPRYIQIFRVNDFSETKWQMSWIICGTCDRKRNIGITSVEQA